MKRPLRLNNETMNCLLWFWYENTTVGHFVIFFSSSSLLLSSRRLYTCYVYVYTNATFVRVFLYECACGALNKPELQNGECAAFAAFICICVRAQHAWKHQCWWILNVMIRSTLHKCKQFKYPNNRLNCMRAIIIIIYGRNEWMHL